jgi:hypothetical protein
MIRILPQPEAGKDGIPLINHAVAIAAVLRLIVFAQRQETVWLAASRLGREIAKQFRVIVYRIAKLTSSMIVKTIVLLIAVALLS